VKFTPEQLRQMGHDLDELRDEKRDTSSPAPPKADAGKVPGVDEPEDGCLEQSVSFTVPGRPGCKHNGYSAHGNPTADYERSVATIAGNAAPHGWPKTERYRLKVGVIYEDRRVGDNTNWMKSIEDGLTNTLWVDDAMVDAQVTFKTARPERDSSLAVIKVERMDGKLDDHDLPGWMREVLG